MQSKQTTFNIFSLPSFHNNNNQEEQQDNLLRVATNTGKKNNRSEGRQSRLTAVVANITSMSDSSNSSDDEPPSAKRSKTQGSSPTSFVTWNVNGLISRCLKDELELVKLLRETGNPDVLCLQEVRLKATSPHNRGTPLPADYQSVKNTMESHVFRRYDKYYSLADTRYAGTCTLVHKRMAFPASDAAFSLPSALSLLLHKYDLTRKDIGITPTNSQKEDPTSSPPAKKKQTSMKAFFAPKPSKKSHNSSTLENSKKALVVPDHHPEGRFQYLFFPSFDLIQTYVPNNGNKPESFQRRQEWDRDMKEFLHHRRLVLDKAGKNKDPAEQQRLRDRPLLWCGDMNVAKDYRDGTHWEQKQPPPPEGGSSSGGDADGVYEWWTDESKCFAGGLAKTLDPSRSRDDRGIPSFTTNERRRFAEILDQADLSDVWRTLHPDGCTDDDDHVANNKNNHRTYKTQWDRPNWTWRGHLSKDGNSYASKYQGKGQRLDYFLLSPSSLTAEIVDRCDILGYGERREGLFCGSDHCVTLLKLKEEF